MVDRREWVLRELWSKIGAERRAVDYKLEFRNGDITKSILVK
jgi:hypothetical protein